MNVDFTHLHVHDEYSALDGFGSPEKFARQAKKMGFRALGITNHGNVDSAIKFQRACFAEGIAPVIGCELYIDKDRHQRGKMAEQRHITVWVKNEIGWFNLLRMLTIANLEGFYRKPRIDGITLLKHIDGLCIGTACLGSFLTRKWGIDLFRQLVEIIPEDLYIEIMPHNWKGQNQFNKKCLEFSNKYDIKIIATNDCHYPCSEDATLQEMGLAIGSGADWDDDNRFRFDVQTLYLCTARKMVKYFNKFHPGIEEEDIFEALNTTNEIVEKCGSFTIKKQSVHLPLIPRVKKNEEEKFFKKLIKRGLRKKIITGQINDFQEPMYKERIEEELSLLLDKGFVRYFLIVWELMQWCKENDIMVGPGRGSVGGCLIAYLIGITEVDTLEYGLIFSRFISPERADMPDIDLDFERGRRGEVIEHIKEIYGHDNVSQIQTYLSMKGKGAIKDVARTFQVDVSEVNRVNKFVDDNETITLDLFETSEEKEMRDFHKHHKSVLECACKMQGTIRGYGSHAAGVCISNSDLTQGKQCNLIRKKIAGRASFLANWDKDDCEYMGLMKLDILGLKTLDRMNYCLKLIKEEHDTEIDLNDIDLNDSLVLKDLDEGETEGVFQLGSDGLTHFCKELRIDSFKDIYNATALFRPGPLRSGMAKEFVQRKHGKPWQAIHDNVKELTKDTYGVILYQEQVMNMARVLAGFSWAKCNRLRKVIAKSKGASEFNKFKDDFINGCVEKKTLSVKEATQLFEEIVSFAAYGFNLSHSVEYSVLSFRDAWLKHYYPLEYFASSLSYNSSKVNSKILELAVDMGYKISLPKIDLSLADKWRAMDDVLIMPFADIDGIGESQAEAIVKESKKKRIGFFKSSSSVNLPTKIKTTLNEIGAYNKKDVNEDYNKIKKIQSYTPYNLIKILNI